MIHTILNWLFVNYLELIGTISGLIYIYFSVKQNILLWLFGIITSLVYAFVFFSNHLYVNMFLQIYYLGVSAYGWYHWVYGAKEIGKQELPVLKASTKEWFVFSGITIVLFLLIVVIFNSLFSEKISYLDSATSAMSIVATWMLARKYLDQWIIWIITNLVYVIILLKSDMYVTIILYTVYTIMAVIGYLEWKRKFHEQQAV